MWFTVFQNSKEKVNVQLKICSESKILSLAKKTNSWQDPDMLVLVSPHPWSSLTHSTGKPLCLPYCGVPGSPLPPRVFYQALAGGSVGVDFAGLAHNITIPSLVQEARSWQLGIRKLQINFFFPIDLCRLNFSTSYMDYGTQG